MKRWMPVIMVTVMLMAMASPAAAALCETCRGKMLIRNIGKCTACGGRTSSGAKKLCRNCSDKQGKCEVCLASLKPAAKKTAPKRPAEIAPGGCVPPKSASAKWVYKKREWGEYNKNRTPMTKVRELLGGKSFVADEKTFAKVWKTLKGDAKAPKIAWSNEMVLYFNVIANNRIRPFVRNDGKGAVRAGAMSTRMGGPGFRWAMMTYPRKGVKTVNGKAVPTCSVDKPKTPVGGRAINLSEGDAGKAVNAQVGDTILIKLKANPSTGYSWNRAKQPKGSAVEFKSKKFLSASQMCAEIRPMPGQGGATTFVYRVVKTGEAKIELTYARPWVKDKKKAPNFVVTIKATKADTNGPTVTGQIVFNAPPNLEKISRIVVSIRNVARMDGPAPLIGQVELKGPFKLPVKFAIPYDASKIRPNPMFYALSARVYTTVGGKERLYYINDTRHGIFTKEGDTKKDIKVKKLR